ncbi:bifunctional heptose 7-phosphate kinase/heptose 1-phosphate adenyltransferase [Rhodophyticola sp. CCM32]|uniref:bifunctional heptose 7-phosphate kinase/heptose 1-phosphate adenyltransferase n=1 Tax=Rhodophyticola sp. CCM32 TaxID=2916397 RepID=UPI00143D6E99|nr:PfkB family carbohydrate kinase [Rhodophyticola sp. CCM32]
MARPYDKPIAVIGDVMLDRYLRGRVNLLSPEAPVPVLNVANQEQVPGGAANVAMNCRALAPEVLLFGLVGDDDAATALTNALRNADVSVHFLKTASPTIVKTRIIDSDRHLLRVDLEKHFPAEDATGLAKAAIGSFDKFGAVLLSDYAKGTLNDPQVYIGSARRSGLRICIDPKQTPFGCYRGAHVLTPNALEFQAATGVAVTRSDFPATATALCAELQLDALLVTAGAAGMYFFEPQKPMQHYAAVPVSPVDVTGAGDVVIAVFVEGLQRELSYEDAVCRANRAAAHSVTIPGTAVVTRAMADE